MPHLLARAHGKANRRPLHILILTCLLPEKVSSYELNVWYHAAKHLGL
jgi:hypothetical protein